MAQTQLIVMLTWHDVTVQNAKEIFLEARDAPAKYWGFKDVGIDPEQMKDLVACMKDAGKTTFMECLATDEAGTERGIRIAADCGFDYLLGAHYYEATNRLAAEKKLRHMPFVGTRRNHNLYGTIEEIASEAAQVCRSTVTGINISAYRYQDGDPRELICSVLAAIDKPLSVAGSVSTLEQIDFLRSAGAWAFTIGGAFFEKKFGETFSEQIEFVDRRLREPSAAGGED
ncbi:hypothetical protein [Feifania hominis]|uniref:4-hydroxythreonine-4-phosphate dehydrogenase n=1 Tax=Feifania hominis TaxID=2763660 RepID=A0A926HU04_9FIRM|nr:hypothetical protein [Feifania hominis]MBC8536404.1 hypothetical protein [Feifania hominis]